MDFKVEFSISFDYKDGILILCVFSFFYDKKLSFFYKESVSAVNAE